MDTLLFTIAYNRNQFLKMSIASALMHARNATYVVWDNANNPETLEIVEMCRRLFKNDTVEVIYRPSQNIGLNAAQEAVKEFRSPSTKYIMSLDEDILMLPLDFQESLKRSLTCAGYVALDVFQDQTTNGAKPPMTSYKPTDIGNGQVLLEGPTGGWASMTTTEVYDSVGGYPVREERFFGLDGIFSESVRKLGKKAGLLQGVCCYHATGDLWNQRFGFDAVLGEKMSAYHRWVRSGSP